MDQDKPILAFPAMNTKMLNHPFVQENLAKLEKLPRLLLHPTGQGLLACAEEGEGKLAKVEEMLTWIDWIERPRTNKTVLITTGATQEPLDSVRYLTNPSQGGTGFFLAREFFRHGYNVQIIAGRDATKNLELAKELPSYQIERICTVEQMKRQVERLLPEADIYISAAAVGDIRFPHYAGKIKKTSLDDSLNILPTEDILRFVLQNKNPRQKVVGFAAEMEFAPEILEQKWRDKPVDLLVGTLVNGGEKLKGFRQEHSHYAFCDLQGARALGELSRSELARMVYQKVADA